MINFHEIENGVYLKAEPCSDGGYILLKFVISASSPISQNIVVYRADATNNFTNYYQIANIPFTVPTTEAKCQIKDCFCESGVPYKYKISCGDSAPIYSDLTIAVLEGVFLSNNELQMKICYDLNISGFKYNFTDVVTPTLGSKYAFIRRNGEQKYRTFNIGGLISYHTEQFEQNLINQDSLIRHNINKIPSMFENSLFFNIKENEDLNPEYYMNLTPSDKERVYEKIFRDKVIAFLTSGDIKLFRSQEEGNIFIRLTNVSLTPKNEIGRMIYSFSAQAIECADANLETYNKYISNLNSLAAYSSDILYAKILETDTIDLSAALFLSINDIYDNGFYLYIDHQEEG